MNNSEILNKLKQINIENNIWVIYIGIIIASYYSNYLEKKYYLLKDNYSKEKYRSIIKGIFTVLTVIYFYFLSDAYKDLTNIKKTDTYKKKQLVSLAFIASLLVFISGLIFLYIAITDDELNIELAFN